MGHGSRVTGTITRSRLKRFRLDEVPVHISDGRRPNTTELEQGGVELKQDIVEVLVASPI